MCYDSNIQHGSVVGIQSLFTADIVNTVVYSIDVENSRLERLAGDHAACSFYQECVRQLPFPKVNTTCGDVNGRFFCIVFGNPGFMNSHTSVWGYGHVAK